MRRTAPPAGRHVRLGDGAAGSPGPATGSPASHVSGEQLAARAVVAGCHVLTTLELLGDEALLTRATSAVRVGNGIGMVVRLGTPDCRLPRDGGLLGVRRDAAAGAEPQPPPGGPRRVQRGSAPTEPAVVVMSLSALTRDRSAGRHNSASGRSGTPTSCRPASTGTTSPRGRPTRSSRRWSPRPRASPARSSTGTCRRRWTSSASSGCARQRDARRDGPGLDVLLPAAARAGGLPYAGARAVPHRCVHAPGRRRVRRVRAGPRRGWSCTIGAGGDDRRLRVAPAAARRGGRRLPWLLRHHSGLEIAYPLVDGAWLHRVTIATVVAFAATCVLHAAVHRGPRWALAWWS